MASLLLAESGSTKTDWCLLPETGSPQHFKTSGINPWLQSPAQIKNVLKQELDSRLQQQPSIHIAFYGAGASLPEQKEKLAALLGGHFGSTKVEVHCDMMGAARAMCGDSKGIVCILGTGSNSCYYDGETIGERHASLGYIAGDEGSGNYLGKKVLQYYAYKTFDEELRMAFEQLFGDNLAQMLHKLYREPFPNRYLAGFVQLLKEQRGHYMVENIVEDGLNEFFHTHIMKYRQSWKLPLYFTGSVAHEFRDVIETLCHQYEIELGSVEKSPMDRLLKYHSDRM